MAKCSFCGKPFMRSTGMLFVKKEGTVYFFCSKKCQRNMLKLGRSPFAVKWTEFYRKAKAEGKNVAETAEAKSGKKKEGT